MATVRPTLKLGQQDDGRFVSSEEFAEADFDEPWKYEREDGRLIVMAPAGEGHSEVSEDWRDWLGAYRLEHSDVVQRVVSEAWVRVDDANDLIGDIGVYLTTDEVVRSRPDRVPDMIFEIVSRDKKSRDRDYNAKKLKYEGVGVREYIVIDKFLRIVTVLTLEPNGYGGRILSVDQTYETPLLPGLSIRLIDVF